MADKLKLPLLSGFIHLLEKSQPDSAAALKSERVLLLLGVGGSSLRVPGPGVPTVLRSGSGSRFLGGWVRLSSPGWVAAMLFIFQGLRRANTLY